MVRTVKLGEGRGCPRLNSSQQCAGGMSHPGLISHPDSQPRAPGPEGPKAGRSGRESGQEPDPAGGEKDTSLGGAEVVGGEAQSRLRGFRPGPRGPGGSCWDPGQPSELSSPGRPCVPKIQTPGGRLSAWLSHELNALPAKSRNVCFHDSVSVASGSRVGSRPP